MKTHSNFTLAPYLVVLIFAAQILISSNINLLYKGTGDAVISYTHKQAIPYVLETDNSDMACMLSGAFAPFILSFSRVTTPPYQLAIMFYHLSGSCSEFKAKEQELRYLRAIHAKNIAEAQDARITQKRLLNKAARLQLTSYQNLKLAFNVEPGGDCPAFKSESSQFYWLIGLINGLQAVLNDLASSNNAIVSLAIPLKVSRAAACLDNNQWWGLPHALQAAVWINFPNSRPADIDPLTLLEQTLDIGLQQNMRISQVIAAQIYRGLGDIDKLKDIIRKHVKERAQHPPIANYKFLDEVARQHIQALSDSLWTEATGKRTPIGQLGRFWDDPSNAVDVVDLADLLVSEK